MAQYPSAATGGGKDEKRGMNERCIKHQSKPVKASRLQKGTEGDKRYVKKWKWERGRSRSTGLLLPSDDGLLRAIINGMTDHT